MSPFTIRQARSEDHDSVAALLRAASLPTEGIAEHFANFLIAENEGNIVGAIGLEVYADTALLRSAVVRSDLQNIGLGSRLYDSIVESARSKQIQRLILLTNTAEKFFARKGFRRIDAKNVTGPITQSVEFTGACPSTATCMELTLREMK